MLDSFFSSSKKIGLQQKIRKQLNSTANLRGNFMFGKERKSPDIVKTKLGGVFTRHNKLAEIQKSKLGDLSGSKKKPKKLGQKVQSLANMIESDSENEEDDFFGIGEENYNNLF